MCHIFRSFFPLSKLLCSVNRIKITFDRIYASGAVCHCCCVIFVQTTKLQLFLMSIWRPNTMCSERVMPNFSFHCLSEQFVPKFRSLNDENAMKHIFESMNMLRTWEKREQEINPQRCTQKQKNRDKISCGCGKPLKCFRGAQSTRNTEQ